MKHIKHTQNNFRTFLVLSLAALIIALPFALQSTRDFTGQLIGSGSTASGTTVEQEVVNLNLQLVQQQVAEKEWQDREARAGSYREEFLKAKGKLERLEAGIENLRKARDVIRAECRVELRKSSVYTLLGVSERCYRESLESEIKILTAEKEYLQNIPGIQPDIRALAETRINLLGDALKVIQTAISNQVFESVEELEEAKNALYKNYRTPKWLMDVRVQSDRLYTHTSSIILRIGEIANEEYDNPDLTNTLIATLTCYTNAESLLESGTSSSVLEEAQNNLTQAIVELEACGRDTVASIEKIKINELTNMDAEQIEELKAAATDEPKKPVGGRSINELNIYGLTDENYVEATYGDGLKIYKYEGYQIGGATPEECDTSTLNRKLQSRLDPNNCRVFDASEFNYYEELLKKNGITPPADTE